ncbi:MAG: hypothetical protein WBZ37_31520 [Mycobacterium sp.]
MKDAEMDRPSRMGMPRSRGAVSGLILVLLGAWGALIPFVGPHFNFAYTPDQNWAWSTARGWLEVLPGAAAVAGGLLLIVAGNRFSAMVGSWLAVLAGGWFVVGGQLAPVLGIGPVGDPIAATDRKRALLEISYFSGLGVVITFVAGVALARTAVRLARDIDPVRAPLRPAPSVPVARPPHYSGLEEPPRDVSSEALTKPAVKAEEPKSRGWRRRQSVTGVRAAEGR